VVTGCLAERYREELRAEIPEIDAVLGTGELPDIVGAVEGRAPAAVASLRFFKSKALPTYLYDATTPRALTTSRHIAYVKVAEGCDYKCAFCIIPTLRGKYRSRDGRSVVDEAQALAARGVRELILISQDTTFYGVDRHERDALPRLMRELNRIEGLEWIRLLYLYPTTISDSMLDAMGECEKICKYIDLPLQHAADEVLRRMKRPGSRRHYERLLTNIRARVPGVALRTTFVVGFPGETDAHFRELSSFVAETAFDQLGVFTYSHEEGTTAHALLDDVPAAVKNRRRHALMSIQRRIIGRAHRARMHQTVRVMVDGTAEEHELVIKGRTPAQAPDVDSVVYLTDCDPSAYAPGDTLTGTIVDAKGYDLIVRPVPALRGSAVAPGSLPFVV
jgi:ribosomal protein S12 methylthiotransferase